MVRIKIGAIEVEYDLVLQPKELRAMVKYLASVAMALAEPEPEEPEEVKPPVALGFTTEIATPIEPDLSEYFEEE